MRLQEIMKEVLAWIFYEDYKKKKKMKGKV